MKRLIFIIFALAPLSGCLCHRYNRVEPSYPQNVFGWKYHIENNVGIAGDFVVKKGESTTNGLLEITVVELLPAQECYELGSSLSTDRVKLRFVRKRDNSLLCEDQFMFGANSCGVPLEEYQIRGIAIRDVNLKDNWVHFELIGEDQSR